MSTNPPQQPSVPLIVRLQELPDLGHGVRATLALQRLRHVAAAQIRAEERDAAKVAERDQEQATDGLYQLAAHDERIEESTPTVGQPMDAFLDDLQAAGFLASTRKPRRGFLRLVRSA